MRFAACLGLLLASAVAAAPTVEPAFTASGEGNGPSIDGQTIHLLTGGEREVNQLAMTAMSNEPPRWMEIRANVRLDPGGEGLGLMLLDTDLAGRDAAPVPPLELPEEPNREGSIGIGFDSRNPPSNDAFDADGNLYDRPQREISVHVDGREILDRQSADFATGDAVPILVRLDFVVGGAKLTVRVGETAVYDGEFLPSVRPFAPRLAMAARAAGKVKLDVTDLDMKLGPAAGDAYPTPRRVVLFDKSIVSLATSREPNAVVDFGEVPANVGRVICTLKLATPSTGPMDKWDRRGALYLYGPDKQRYEVLRFKTPFLREWEWQVDVTDFLPLFRDQRNFGMFIDTWRDGFAISATLDFYPGKPERNPIGIVNLWQGEPILGNPEMPVQKFFDEKTVLVAPGATGGKVRLVVSGHGQFPNSKNAGEFLGLNRSLWINKYEFKNLLWKTDNYLNPCRPQKGTWKYDRAGWGPGAITPPWTIDIGPILKQSPKELTLDYAIMDAYVNEHIGKGDPPTHWVDGQVIFYGEANATTPPAMRPSPAAK